LLIGQNLEMKILLAEDHNIVRNGIKMLLETTPDIEIVGEATDGKQVIEMVNNGQAIDIVLADINMPEMDGITLTKALKKIDPEIKVVILSMHDSEKYVVQAFLEGAAGYMLKNVSADELIFSLMFIGNGGKYLCAELVMKLIDNLITHKQHQQEKTIADLDFSVREIEVLQLIADGLTNAEMSDKLFISKRTIEGHRQSLLDKTGSKNTASLVRFAVQNHIIH